MCAQFTDIQEVFTANSLSPPELNLLVPDTHPYEILAIQPTGAVEVRPDFVGHSNRATATSKFSSFLQLAVDQNSDLVVSPEYSCPWDVLASAIAGGRLPQRRKLWALACEAISPGGLREFTAAHPQVVWIHEPIPAGAGQFLGVLAYILKTDSLAGGVRDVVVLQFKTEPMGGDIFESEHLIRAQTIYSWHNPDDNIRLVSLLCSDALAFDGGTNRHCRFDCHPYIIFHPQLNRDPRHADISAYRDRLFSREVSEAIEVLTLNWARGFTILAYPASPYGGSAIYTKSAEFDCSDARIVGNHQRGVYLAFWHAHRTQLCLFNYDEHVFHFRIPKAMQDAPAVAARRTGPEMIALRTWNIAQGAWLDAPQANDGFDQLCLSFNEPHCDYCSTAPHNAIDRERLLMLAAGNLPDLRPELKWHQVHNLDSFRSERDERTKRLTFTHEQAPDSATYRQQHLGRFIILQMVILADPANFPRSLHDLRGDWQLRPPRSDDGFRFNLYSRSGLKQGATAIFLGLVPIENVRRLRNDIARAWEKPEYIRRLVIWYQVQNSFHSVESSTPTITDDSELPDSYARSTPHEQGTNAQPN
jgi:hypothetical protein